MRRNPKFTFRRFNEAQDSDLVHGRFAPEDGALCALMHPTDGAGVLRLVEGPLVTVLEALKEPGLLPTPWSSASDRTETDQVAGLLLDGLLEVEVDGSFVSGTRAWRAVNTLMPLPEAPAPLWELSRQALDLAGSAPEQTARDTFLQLYGFHRLPWNRRWRQVLSGDAPVERFLGLSGNGPLQRLDRVFRRRPPSPSHPWWSWQRRTADDSARQDRFKLYLSPLPGTTREALERATPILAESPVNQLKVPARPEDLLRPDKIVLYCADFNSLRETAQHLAPVLESIPPHGVPFTAPILPKGQLSWAVDPTSADRLPGIADARSWRAWVLRRLAQALRTRNLEESPSLPPWRFALERVRLDGVDVLRWLPDRNLPTLHCVTEAPS